MGGACIVSISCSTIKCDNKLMKIVGGNQKLVMESGKKKLELFSSF